MALPLYFAAAAAAVVLAAAAAAAVVLAAAVVAAVCVRECHAELQLVRDEVSYTAGLLDTCKAELAAGFEEWYTHTYGTGGQQQQQHQKQQQVRCMEGRAGGGAGREPPRLGM